MALRTVCVTPREFTVACELAADGASNRDIAERLYISEDTVKSHIKSALKKAGCESRTELAVKMARQIIALRPVNNSGRNLRA